MFKKKFYFVALSTLLLTLLLGLCGSCYAVELGQVKNLVYNAMVTGNGVSESEARIKITDYDYWDTIESYCNDNYHLVGARTSTTGRYEFYFEPASYNTQLRVYTYNNEIRSDLYTKRNLQFVLANTTFTAAPTTWNSAVGTHLRVYDLYSENDIYTYNTENILYNGPYSEPSWFNTTGDYYSEIVWNFIPNGSIVTLQNDNQWQYRLISAGWGIDFGSISDSEWVNKISYRVAYWNKGLSKFGAYGNFFTIYDYSKNGPLYKYWPGTTTNVNGVYTTRITLDNYNYQNCLMQIVIESSIPGQLPTKYIDYYIESSNTVVQNGVVITSSIFSGDYMGDYDNQQQENQNNDNTDKIVDSINSTDGADELINSYLSGDVDSWGADLGYHPFENPFTSFLFNLVNNVYDSLTRRGNVVLDFNHHNSTGWVINTDEFITPEGPLKNLIRWSMIFFYLYGNYKFFHYLLTLIETAKIDKAIATLGTDEFYDSDIM